MYLYWPVLLIGLTVIILFLPAPILYHKSRSWFLYSLVGSPHFSFRQLLRSQMH